MAASKTSLLQPENGAEVSAPSSLASEIGYTGLKISNKRIYEEADSRLRFPNLVPTIDDMRKDSMVSAALQLYRMFICNRDWKAEAPVGASKKTIQRTEFLNQCLEDMDWYKFISQVATMVDYGFSIHEVVLYKRLKSNGSKFNDGLYGIKDLPIRAQATIGDWIYSDDGRELIAIEQDLGRLTNSGRYMKLMAAGKTSLEIPFTVDGKTKLLHFRCDPRNDNPEGMAPLKASYRAWKIKSIVEESELNGISRDLGGVPCVRIPSRYMSDQASEGEKKIYEYFKGVARNIHNNSQAGLVLPSDVDELSKARMFDFELVQGAGSKSYDTTEIIKRLNTEILMSLFADVLQLGSNGSGSFALSNDKTTIVSTAIEHRLREIRSVLNANLIPTLWKQNGWDLSELPTFEYSEIDKPDMEELSKAIQRAASVGLLEVEQPVLNVVRSMVGVPLKPDDAPIDKDNLTMAESKSGAGMQSPTGEGTSKTPSGKDTSGSNVENKG